MAIIRGSTHRLVAIPEVTFGVTPATPAMSEIAMTQLQKKLTNTVLRSAQIRSHPFVDRLLYGRIVQDLSVDGELQDQVSQDILLSAYFGAAITAKALVFTDAIKSLSAESQSAGAGGSLFDLYSGWFFNKLTVSAAAADTTPVKFSLTGVAKVGALDNPTAVTGETVTAITAVDPFIFADATLTVGGTATAVMSGSFDISRVVDPLMLWGSRLPREFIPGDVTATGSLVIPYDGNVQSGQAGAFTDEALVFTFNNVGTTTFRKFTFPKVKFSDISRPVTTRAGIMQTITIEPYYDTATSTVCTMTTE